MMGTKEGEIKKIKEFVCRSESTLLDSGCPVLEGLMGLSFQALLFYKGNVGGG